MNKYSDIINLNRPISIKHKPMSISDRASQFSSFDALEGYKDEIVETNRYVDKKIILNEDKIIEINYKLSNINNKYKITYFIKDKIKNGGIYNSKIDYIKKIDDYNKIIILNDNTTIKINDIIDMKEEV